MQQRKMFKVISPIEKHGGGGQWWMRCGTAFVNKDESINVYIDVLPLAGMAKNDGIKLQLREYTEAELQERAEKKASYQSRGTFDANGLPSMSGGYGGGAADGGRGVGNGGGGRGAGSNYAGEAGSRDGGGRGAGSGGDVDDGPIPF